jgi:hypothetical protein
VDFPLKVRRAFIAVAHSSNRLERKSGRVPAKRRWGRKIANGHALINAGTLLAADVSKALSNKKSQATIAATTANNWWPGVGGAS